MWAAVYDRRGLRMCLMLISASCPNSEAPDSGSGTGFWNPCLLPRICGCRKRRMHQLIADRAMRAVQMKRPSLLVGSFLALIFVPWPYAVQG